MSMDKPKRNRKARRLWYARLALLLFFVLILVLLVVARNRPHGDNRAQIDAILRQAEVDRLARARAAEAARAALPPDAALAADWDYRPVLELARGRTGMRLRVLVSQFIQSPENMAAALKESYDRPPDFQVEFGPGGPPAFESGPPPGFEHEHFEHEHGSRSDNPLYFKADLDTTPPDQLASLFCTFLRECKPLRELEAGVRLGLMADVADAYENPMDSRLTNCAVYLAGRALCEVRAGDTAAALETLLSGYDLAALLADWPHGYAHSQRFFADRVLDTALYRIVEAGPLSAVDRDRILAKLELRKPVDKLAISLRTQAARIEIGEGAGDRELPQPIAVGFAFAGRGALDRIEQLISLLDTPPYAVRDQLRAISKHRPAAQWVNRLLDNAVQDYKMHTRESLMADIARLAFALDDWRRAKGAYPAAIEELAPFPLPEMPVDPVTGAAVVYARAGEGYTLGVWDEDSLPGEFLWEAKK